jgi:hypothetical protein
LVVGTITEERITATCVHLTFNSFVRAFITYSGRIASGKVGKVMVQRGLSMGCKNMKWTNLKTPRHFPKDEMVG